MSRAVRAVAHDLNNVFAAILGSADLIVMRLDKTDPSLEEAQEIQRAAERGAALVRRLFALNPRGDRPAPARATRRPRTTDRKKSSR
jgi:signal transduction histidine kinase